MTTGPFLEGLKFGGRKRIHVYRLNKDNGEIWYGTGDAYYVGRGCRVQVDHPKKNAYSACWAISENPGEVYNMVLWMPEPDYEKAVVIFKTYINHKIDDLGDQIYKNQELLKKIEYREELFVNE